MERVCVLREGYGTLSTSMDKKQNLTVREGDAGGTVITLLLWLMTLIQFISSYHGF